MSECVCPKCNAQMGKVSSLVNEHVTGDDKYIKLYQCAGCNESHLFVSMFASLSYADNHFVFRIALTEEEARQLGTAMTECPREGAPCPCPAHDLLDHFDYGNKSRRVVICDEYDYYVPLDELNKEE